MICAYVREDKPRALAGGLSPVHTHSHMHVHFVHCEIFDVEHWNITQRCNKPLGKICFDLCIIEILFTALASISFIWDDQDMLLLIVIARENLPRTRE